MKTSTNVSRTVAVANAEKAYVRYEAYRRVAENNTVEPPVYLDRSQGAMFNEIIMAMLRDNHVDKHFDGHAWLTEKGQKAMRDALTALKHYRMLSKRRVT